MFLNRWKHLLFACVCLAVAAGAFLFSRKTDAVLQEVHIDQIIAAMEEGPVKNEVIYGRDLVFDTAKMIGPLSEKKISGNLMTCTHCHIRGGGVPYGLPLFDSHGQYPQYRSREGKILTLAERVNSCLTNPLRGGPLPVDSREMHAILLYLRFLGGGRPILLEEKDQRLPAIDYPDVAASPERGRHVFKTHCTRCHGESGAGVKNAEGTGFVYPPLWGPESYAFGSSMSRVSIFARFVKANMPFGEATYLKPVLSDMEALDVAAFVNSEQINSRPEPAPGKVLYPTPELKPFDYSRGPFADNFPPDQHKYGPFKPIIQFHKEKRLAKKPSDGDLNAP